MSRWLALSALAVGILCFARFLGAVRLALVKKGDLGPGEVAELEHANRLTSITLAVAVAAFVAIAVVAVAAWLAR